MNSKAQQFKTTIQSLLVFCFVGCSHEEFPLAETQKRSPQKNASDQMSMENNQPAQVNLTEIQDNVSSLQPALNIDYRNSDYVAVLRCQANYKMRSPTGRIIRDDEGMILSNDVLELRAAWETAFGSFSSCRLLGERFVRQAFNDALSPTGTYFYIFNPCREQPMNGVLQSHNHCSFDLKSSGTIRLSSTLSQRATQLAELLIRKESELTTLMITFREHVMNRRYTQQSCENQNTVDAVQEAKRKALLSLLTTGIAASIGGAVAGSDGAILAAQKTLEWIKEHVALSSKNQPKTCKVLIDAEKRAEETAVLIEQFAKEIGQLKAELAYSE